tara:strand:+ start:409 stop:540 length:132 start_codon:yes stop_codon:yes gene_type:complete
MTREETEKMLREELGELDDDDDREVAEASARFDEISHKISLLL